MLWLPLIVQKGIFQIYLCPVDIVHSYFGELLSIIGCLVGAKEGDKWVKSAIKFLGNHIFTLYFNSKHSYLCFPLYQIYTECCRTSLCLEIWVMKEYKLQSSWTKYGWLKYGTPLFIVLSADHKPAPSRYFVPVCYTKSGDIVGTHGCAMLAKWNDNGLLQENQSYMTVDTKEPETQKFIFSQHKRTRNLHASI